MSSVSQWTVPCGADGNRVKPHVIFVARLTFKGSAGPGAVSESGRQDGSGFPSEWYGTAAEHLLKLGLSTIGSDPSGGCLFLFSSPIRD
eukprot:758599-Hanusia_phi.AAC.7